MSKKAATHLKTKDRKLKKLIEKIGPIALKPKTSQSPFEALVEAIVYQQLHAKAAATIFGRVLALFPPKKFPKPADFLITSDTKLRSAGLSAAKTAAIKDLAQKTIDGVVPSQREIEKLADEEIIERLCQVHGIGRWTVEMLLIFKLGRPDILPATDYAIRKAFGKIYSKKELPPPKEILTYGEIWKPHRSFAALYLWRSIDG